MYLIIDNYDSFTYNLSQYLMQIYQGEVVVARNDRINIEQVEGQHPEGIIISPGPGRPQEAGICVELINHFAGKVPILGICLGHQAIGYAFGGSIRRAKRIVHGKTDEIIHDGCGLFRNIPSPIRCTRYHSLAIGRDDLPPELEITATSPDGEIMGVRHREHAIEGVQFHPESIASEFGKKLLVNFLHYRRETFNFPAVLSGILAGNELSEETASFLMDELTDGELTEAQAAALLIALNAKEVTARELCSFASVLKRKQTVVHCVHPLLDTCGTGGDAAGTFNISSMAAVVASACGARVAKHGNRCVSSRCGSADFYEQLGIPTTLSPEASSLLLERTGFAFLFAPLYHRSMKHVAKVRRELGVKTVMNLLGPLVNPAGPCYQLLGVYADKLCLTMAEATKRLGSQRVMVVHSCDGLDEISVCAPTRVVEVDEGGRIKDYFFNPSEIGIPLYAGIDLAGGSPQENAGLAREIASAGGPPAVREAVLLNAGAALYTSKLAGTILEGYRRAREALEQGLVYDKLEQIREESEKIMSSPIFNRVSQ